MSAIFEKTIDPKLYDLNIYFEPDFYDKYTNFGEDYIKFGFNILDYFTEYNKTNVIFDPIKSKADIYEELDKRNGSSPLGGSPINTMPVQFQVFWYEQFLTSVKQVQNKFIQKVGNPNFFREISDSIGLLRNVNYMEDDAILPIWDLDFNIAAERIEDMLIPEQVASSTVRKISPISQVMITQMALYTTNVYRHNMFAINDQINNSKQAHGSNLVADYYHFDRMFKIAKEDLEADLALYFREVYELILWYENYNPQNPITNKQFVDKNLFYMDIQDVDRAVTFIKEQVDFYNDQKSFIDSLGVTSV